MGFLLILFIFILIISVEGEYVVWRGCLSRNTCNNSIPEHDRRCYFCETNLCNDATEIVKFSLLIGTVVTIYIVKLIFF